MWLVSPFLFAAILSVLVGCVSLPPGPVTPRDSVEEALIRRQEENAERALAQLKIRKRSPKRFVPQKNEAPWEEELRSTHIKRVRIREQSTVDEMPTAILRPQRPDPEVIPESERVSEFEGAAPLQDSEHAILHLYREGLKHLDARKWDAAISSFTEFIKDSPEHIYADRAAYWISHCHYMAGDHGLAVVTSNQFETRYPHSQRLPELIYYRALSLVELGHYEEAVPELRGLLSKFPASQFAADASRRLAEITVQDKSIGSP